MRRDPPPPFVHRRWWMAPALVALLAVPTPWVLAAFAVVVAARIGQRAIRSGRIGWNRRRAGAEARAGSAVALGTDFSGRAVRLTDAQLGAHGLIVGASGAGKSTTLLTILATQIRRGLPVVAIDLKGSPGFARQLEAAALAAGRPFRCWSPDGQEHWNPLADGNPTELKDKLIATERFTEPHYQRAAERYLQTALQVMRETEPERPITLAGVVELCDPPRLASLARRLPSGRAERVRDYLATLAPDQLSAVRGLASRLALISESHVGERLTPPPSGGGVDLRAALAGEEVVLFSLNSSTYGKLAAQLGTLAVQDLVTAAGHRLTQETGGEAPAIVGIDEFSALDSDNVLSLLVRGREAGVSILLATQELADLDRAGRGLRAQVLGNTAVKIAHRQDVPESAETVARMAGTDRVWERSYHLRPGRLGLTDTRGGTLRLVERYAIDPDQVRSLRTGDAVVIVKTPRSSARLTRVTPTPARGGPER